MDTRYYIVVEFSDREGKWYMTPDRDVTKGTKLAAFFPSWEAALKAGEDWIDSGTFPDEVSKIGFEQHEV